MNTVTELARVLLQEDDYTLVGHAIPDGDCIGSLLALYVALVSKGKKTRILLQDPAPSIYRYLPAVQAIEPPQALENGPACVIFLDCGDERRTGDTLPAILKPCRLSVNIDHHQGNELFGDYNLVDTSAAATAEIVYELLLAMEVEITIPIASALFAGLVMDSGSFMNGNTTPRTFRMAANLLERGVDINAARINLLESKSLAEIRLLAQALANLTVSNDGKIAWMKLSGAEVERAGARNLNPEGLINYTRMIEGVEVGLLFREVNPGLVKVGFRSRQEIDVAALAQKFDGGGHRQAAGAVQSGTLEEVSARVLMAVRGVMN